VIEALVRDVIVTLSAFSIGSALFTASLALRMYRTSPRRYASFASAKVGYALVVGTVLLRIVLPNRELPIDPWSTAYIAGLVFAGLGFVGVGRTIRREFVAWETQREQHPDATPDIEELHP
jgi:hypothetical protein